MLYRKHFTLVWSLISAVHGDLRPGAVAARAASPATVSLVGPFTGTAASSALPAGTAVNVQDLPSGGVDVYLSDDLRAKVESAAKQNCQGTDDQACQKAITAALQDPSVDLQARIVPFVIGGIAVIYGAILADVYKNDKQVPKAPIHIPAVDLSQAGAVATASTVVIVPTKGADTTVTVPTPASVPSSLVPAWSTASSGDFQIHMPQDLAARTEEIIKRYSSNCSAGKHKRGSGLPACDVLGAATDMLVMMTPGAPLRALALAAQANPILPLLQNGINDLMGTFGNTIVAMAGALQLSPQMSQQAGLLAVTLAYEVLVNGMTLSSDIVIPKSDIQTSTKTTTKTKTGCAEPTATGINAPACQDKECNAKTPKNVCQAGKYQDCDCMMSVSYPHPDYYDTAAGNQQFTALQAILVAEAVSALLPKTTVPPTTTTMLTTTTFTPTPSATSSILIIWDTPPKTGKPFYDVYLVKAGFKDSLNTGCGSNVPPIAPLFEAVDPKSGDVSAGGPREPVMHRVPIDKLGTFANGCYYADGPYTHGAGAQLFCSKNTKTYCEVPDDTLLSQITPNNDKCGGMETRTLVAVCPLS